MSKHINRRRFLRDLLGGSGLALATLFGLGNQRGGLAASSEYLTPVGDGVIGAASAAQTVGHSIGVSDGVSMGYTDSVDYGLAACAGGGKTLSLVRGSGVSRAAALPTYFPAQGSSGGINGSWETDPGDPPLSLPIPTRPELT